jgi:hypothetical protein
MLLSNVSVKLRSLGLSPLVLTLALGTGAATTGCIVIHDDQGGQPVYDGDDTDPGTDPGEDPGVQISQVEIQPDQILQAAPGEGVGIFVEYATGGKWRVWTTCDTFTSKKVCSFDILASTPHFEQLRAYAMADVEGFDAVKDRGDGTIEFIADTDSDTDALVLDMDENAPLELEVYIDGQSAEPYVYWVSRDVIHGGAPANPVQFLPAVITK